MTAPTHDLDGVADGFAFLEAPRWHRGCLWLADMYAQRVVALREDGTVATSIALADEPAGLGWAGDRLLVALRNDRRLVTADPGGVSELTDLSVLAPAKLNDMSIDGVGRAYVGNFGIDSGSLIRVDPDGTPDRVAESLLLPNGSAITSDGATLIVAESAGQRLTAFAISRDGALTGRRVWAAFGNPPRARRLPELLSEVTTWPDGIALDAEGAVWVADAFGHAVIRVREGGEITDRISTGMLAACACALGGRDGRTLFVCVAPRAPEAELKRRRAAQLLRCRVSVPAAAPPGE